MGNLRETKFWEFGQNNSGGFYVEDDVNGVCESVIIEAQTANAAWEKLNDIGDRVNGFWDFCDCCGERWRNYMSESDGKNVPMHYDTPLQDVRKSTFNKRAFVHYIDGTIKEFIYK